jgi:hypothetical protein
MGILVLLADGGSVELPCGSSRVEFVGSVSHLELRCSDGMISPSANRAQTKMTTYQRSFLSLLVGLKVTCPDTTSNLPF